MKKINAFTLLEVVVALLLSAIVISICYVAYGIIGNSFTTFQEKNKTADNLLSLRYVMERDFWNSRYVLSNGHGITINQDSLQIYYIFQERAILRKISEQHTDTFDIKHRELRFFFEGNEIIDSDTIDMVKFNLELGKNNIAPTQLFKHYSAKDLFH